MPYLAYGLQAVREARRRKIDELLTYSALTTLIDCFGIPMGLHAFNPATLRPQLKGSEYE